MLHSGTPSSPPARPLLAESSANVASHQNCHHLMFYVPMSSSCVSMMGAILVCHDERTGYARQLSERVVSRLECQIS